MKDPVKVPLVYLQTWHKNLLELSRKHPMQFPEKMAELLQEVRTYSESSVGALLDIPYSKLESWKTTIDVYLSLAIERFLLPPSLYDLAERMATNLASFAKPHLRCITSGKMFRIEEVKPHYYGGVEIALSDSDVVEVDFSPISHCTDLKQIWLTLDKVKTIDLSPLGACIGLESFYLSANSVEKIDLKPIAACTNLKNVDLLAKRLSNLDLTPLGECANLRSLNISNTNLKSLDLEALGKCKELMYLCLDSNHLSNLNLEPISSCHALNSFSIEKNEIDKIDLAHLGYCKELQYLGLGNNALSKLDLSPLEGKTNLRKLKLENNRIRKIDLSPLRDATNLAALDISGNRIHEIDLSPLSGLPSLEELSLRSNLLVPFSVMSLACCRHLSKLDFRRNAIPILDISGPLCTESPNLSISVDMITRLEADSILKVAGPKLQLAYNASMSNLHWRPLNALFEEFGWEEVKKRIQMYLKCLPGARKFAAKRAFFEEVGMEEVSGVDKDIAPLLESTGKRKTLRSIKKKLYAGVVELLQEQIEKGGSTFFLDVEAMKETQGASLAEHIVERRNREIEDAVVPIKGGRVHLEPLWLTVHGFHILSSLKMPLKTTTPKKFKQVENAFAEQGFKVKTAKFKEERLAKQYSVAMSSELRQYILELAALH
ncbi:MAG: leucine-rich repeat domain-containing protein [Candidatus Thorarchaeota archaeon]|nr:leucine-rich repeat domain-containing protein [Candidatus Thorarchaeota archaeon]